MLRALSWVTIAAVSLVACGRDWDAFEVGQGSGGDSGGDAGGNAGFGGGTCFPGSKVCPDPTDPTGFSCVTADEPASGCSKSSSCSPCSLPHATAKCSAGACVIDQCDAAWNDCNDDPADGCEADLNGDKSHCGTCSNDCVAAKGPGWICNSGTCEVNECCPTGDPSCSTLRDCDGNKANACEVDVAKDPANCKSCGNSCQLAHAKTGCSQQVCVVTQCDPGWANCDGADVNGCESNVNQGDKANCGACGKKCNEINAGATCVASTCQLACHPGWGNCDLDPDNGCEANIASSTSHCNGCNKPCNPANVNQALCNSGACDYLTCKNGFADCDGSRTNGCEINILQNVSHCGGCGKKCTAPSGGSAVCSNGSCAESCSSGLTNCSGVCVALGADVDNCGACGIKCPLPANATATCSGSCGFACNNGFHKCGVECRSNSDATACGTSCQVCPPPTTGSGNPICSSGTCGLICTAPTTGKCGTACYNFGNDKNNCGSCGNVCPGTCNAGACA